MSGTSLDGLDIAYCSFQKGQFSLLSVKTIPYSKGWKERLKTAHSVSPSALTKLDADLARYFSLEILQFIKENNIQYIDAISSHGHTVFHQPDKSYTLQIANPAYISAITGIKVIGDFRSSDVALGGQGAPLVPIGDRDLFSAYENRINLGGFANISFEEGGSTHAFDICPLNIILNDYATNLGFQFDESGNIAKSGELNSLLLNELNKLNYYKKKGPKSLGKEYVQSEFLPILERYSSLSTSDILRTLVEHMALQISLILKPGKAMFSGGGVHNLYLMERIENLSENDIVIPNNNIIEFKEALIFAYLGYLRIHDNVNVLASVTGASKDHISGGIYLP